nr:ATP synthase F0 subunit 8 [Acorhinotermes subfusciceps]
MPQMMPMEWTTLHASFLMTFLMFNILNYYTNMVTENPSTKKIMNQPTFNWKW